MKVLLSWLREFVDVREDAAEIARVMSLRGFAVEGLERFGEDTVIQLHGMGPQGIKYVNASDDPRNAPRY